MKKRNKIILAALNALCLVCILAGVLVMSALRGKLESQQAAARWRGENELRFAQVSVFTTADGALSESGIGSFRTKIDTALPEAGILPPETGRLWSDAYCAVTSASAVGPRGTVQTTALAVGGDFFSFHPLHLYDGRYLAPDDLMKDMVVVNEMLAWKLYGGRELAGMSVTVNGKNCIIAGVVAVEEDFASARAIDADEPLLFMPYEAAADADGKAPGITCYELVMPDPLTGYAKQLVSDNIGNGRGAETVENSARFSGKSIRAVLGAFGEQGMRKLPIEYPYWENAARCVESYLALVWLLTAVFCILPVLTCIGLLVWLFRIVKRRAKGLRKRAGEALERRRERRWEKQEALRRAERQPADEDKTPSDAAGTDEKTADAAEPESASDTSDGTEDVRSVIRAIREEKERAAQNADGTD